MICCVTVPLRLVGSGVALSRFWTWRCLLVQCRLQSSGFGVRMSSAFFQNLAPPPISLTSYNLCSYTSSVLAASASLSHLCWVLSVFVQASLYFLLVVFYLRSSFRVGCSPVLATLCGFDLRLHALDCRGITSALAALWGCLLELRFGIAVSEFPPPHNLSFSRVPSGSA